MRAERPILFSGPMVRAILDGTKTMTRRPTKEAQWNRRADSRLESVQPGWKVRGGPASSGNDWVATFVGGGSMPGGRWQMHALACPFGAPGDRLWVRETMRLRDPGERTEAWVYSADGAEVSLPKGDPRVGAMLAWAHHKEGNTCVSIHMPRWAVRHVLEVAAVRVERLQDITEEDARAEGVTRENVPAMLHGDPALARQAAIAIYGEEAVSRSTVDRRVWPIARNDRDLFMLAWTAINGKRAPWASNPWVWCVSFKRVRP